MIGVVINAVILIALLKALSDAEVSFLGAVLVSLGTSLAGFVLSLVLSPSIGVAGAFVALGVVATGLAVVLSAAYGIDLRRAGLIALLYFVAQVILAVVLTALLKP